MRILKTIFLIFLLSDGVLIAQDSLSTGWLQTARNATVALGARRQALVTDENGQKIKKEIFGVIGTGVILGMPDDKAKLPWLVTSKHIFYDPKNNWDPKTIQIRFAWFDQNICGIQ